MKKKLLLIMFALVLVPVLASAAQVEGTVQGYTCVTQGKVCPVGKEDPMVAVERVFVVLTAGGDYYFVLNVDRAVLARHIRKKIRVTGALKAKFKSITARKLERRYKGGWKITWSPAMERDIEKMLR